jgi:hypothetical protein
MHEFCDGCACQYKSRHCFGDLASSTREFGFQGIIRIFFETSQARGPQDAAGGLLKNQADMAIIRGRVTIQNAFGLYKFAKDNLTIPKSHGCQRRSFKYIETIPRSVTRQYKLIPGIISIHQVLVKKENSRIGLCHIIDVKTV